MGTAPIHALFDVAAWLTALAALLLLRRTWFRQPAVEKPLRLGYLAAVLFGAGAGAWVFGTLNLLATGISEIGRSIEGALFGAILAIEVYKKAAGIRVRTGAIYALPVAVGIGIGRIGCLLSGLEDNTHGIATGAGWGWDFGDGILRHPVQLYEAMAMALFAAVYVAMLLRGSAYWRESGFYLMILFYAVQRFIWEFLKPYAAIGGGLTVFQMLSIVLAGYGLAMIVSRPTEGRESGRTG